MSGSEELDRNRVASQYSVLRNQGQGFADGLGYQGPVEGVLMVARQTGHFHGVLGRER